jgi:hypothetical protein
MKRDRTAAARQRAYRERKRALAARDSCNVTSAVTPAEVSAQIGPGPSPATVTNLPSGRRPIVLIAVTLSLAITIGAIGLYLNGSFLYSFGRTTDAGIVLAVVGVTLDCAALLLPSVTIALWARRCYTMAVTAVTAYLGVMAVTVLNGLGFANHHVGDAVAARGAVVEQRTALTKDIAQLRSEQAGLKFVPTTAAAVSAAQSAKDAECLKRGPLCRDREADLTLAIGNWTLTDHAADLDRRITAATDMLVGLPAVATIDPQVAAAVAVVPWLSRGTLVPAASDIEMVRLLGVAMIPILGGLLLAYALILAQTPRGNSR